MRALGPGGENLLPGPRKPRAIFAQLCLARGKGVPRARLIHQFWERLSEERADTNFRQALSTLYSALGGYASDLIVTEHKSVYLDISRCWIDVLAILDNVAAVADAELVRLAGTLLLEEFDGLSGAADLWLAEERRRFAEELRTVLDTDLQRLVAGRARPADLARAARRFAAVDPANEMACRIGMLALTRMGERSQAIELFQRCSDALRRLLDIAPSDETLALYEALRSGDSRIVPRTMPRRPAGILLPKTRLAPAPPPHERARIRIGVTPFRLLSDDIDEAMPATLSQELAGALSRLRWFDVVPFGPDERPQAGHGPRVDYLLDGVLSAGDDRVGASLQLVDVGAGMRPLWGENFEVRRGSLAELNRQIATKTAGRIGPVLVFAAGQRATERNESDGTALWLKAIPLMYSMERDKFESAGRLLARAYESDPDNAMFAAWRAYWQVYHVGQGWTADASAAFENAEAMCVKAMRLDPDNAEAQGIYGHICSFLHRDFDNAMHYFDRSLRLNPNSALIWALSAATHCYIGAPDAALERLDRYRELAPFDPYFLLFESIYSIAHAVREDYARAALVGRRAVAANPGFVNGYKHLIAALGHLGRREEAARYIEKLLALEPGFTISRFLERYPFVRKEDRERYVKGLRLAGIAE